MREQVEDEMSEADFNSISWLMEMQSKFYGESEKAFFKFTDLERNRVLPKVIYPRKYYEILKNKDFKYIPKEEGEVRIISCDISSMDSTKGNNDNSVFTIGRLIPSKNKLTYDKHIVYIHTMEGGRSDTQALEIRRLYEQYDCDYIVIDTQSFGLSIFDELSKNIYDKEYDVEYEALSCYNDEEIAKRCFIQDAPKVIWSIKANAQLNSDMHIYVKDELTKGKLRLPVSEQEGREHLSKFKGFKDLPMENQVEFEMPYIQTSLLINEMINLEKVDTGNNYIKLKEPSTKRKDRYSSLGYLVYVSKQLELKLKPKKENKIDLSRLGAMARKANIYRK